VSDAHDAALGRLIASRARLAQILLPAPATSTDGAHAAGGANGGWSAPRRWRAWWRRWTRQGTLAPVFVAVEHGLGGWWQRQPWRDTASVIGELGAANVRPFIRRHPLAAIGLGAAAGAALAWSQPWRWRALRVHAMRSSRLAAGWAVGQLSQPAIQLLLTGLLVSKARASAPVPEAAPPV
jgi:hypothetical protein